MEIKEIKTLVEGEFKNLSGQVNDKLTAQKDAIVKEFEEKGFTSKADVEALIKTKADELEAALMQVKKSAMKANEQKMTFGQLLGKALKENKDALNGVKSGNRDSVIQLKAAAPEDFDEIVFDNSNTPSPYGEVTTDRTRGMYQYPYEPLWLRNVLPNSTTNGSVIHFLKEDWDVSNTTGAAVWDGSGIIDDLGNKPGVNFNFELETATVDWIAGISRVKREMLDDIPWLRSYLTRQLTVGRRGLFVAENTLILGELNANSVNYDGANDIPVEMIYDAAFGQLRDNYYNPNVILMNHRDVVNLIALNKAQDSGVYNLPAGTVAIIGGQLLLGGVPVIGVPNIVAGTAYVIDRNATEFVSRMNPEIRFFEEDRDNVPKNLITVRAEERVAAIVYDNKAVVKVEFDQEVDPGDGGDN